MADFQTTLTGVVNRLQEQEFMAAVAHGKEKDGPASALMGEVALARDAYKSKMERGAFLKDVLGPMRTAAQQLQEHVRRGVPGAREDLRDVQKQQERVQDTLVAQAKAVQELESDMELFRKSINSRIEYYRQLQQISDTVQAWREQLDGALDQAAFAAGAAQVHEAAAAGRAASTKRLYLEHLHSDNTVDGMGECAICRERMEVGVLTSCGHASAKIACSGGAASKSSVRWVWRSAATRS